MRFFSFNAIVVVALVLAPLAGQPCSSFGSPSTAFPIMGKSYDWQQQHGMIVVNKRNVRKTAISLDPQDIPAHWISKYGSVSFNQFGRELSNGGINEKGLAVEILWHADSVPPSFSSLPVLNEAQWVQYHLDLAADIDDMIALARQVRVKPFFAQVHYFACDASAKCASFEYLNGELIVHAGDSLPFKTQTNTTYSEAQEYTRQHQGFGGNKEIPDGLNSADRFVRLSDMAKNLDGQAAGDAVRYGFQMLDSVLTPGFSRWQIVYDLKNRKIYFSLLNGSDRTGMKSLALDRFDFSCATPVKVFALESRQTGDISAKFTDYTLAANREIVAKSGKHIGAPDEIIEATARYPESTECLKNRAH